MTMPLERYPNVKPATEQAHDRYELDDDSVLWWLDSDGRAYKRATKMGLPTYTMLVVRSILPATEQAHVHLHERGGHYYNSSGELVANCLGTPCRYVNLAISWWETFETWCKGCASWPTSSRR